jgi:stage II sporulation protein D
MENQPHISVGLCENYGIIEGHFEGPFRGPAGKNLTGPFRAAAEGTAIVLTDGSGREILRKPVIRCNPGEGATFSLAAVTIGRSFHWERQQSQIFEGALTLAAGRNGGVTAINTLPLESYLASVISSEMSGAAPPEFLKAQAITSRSWLVAMLEKKERVARTPLPSVPIRRGENEMIRWYDRQDHQRFDVCADDHCQRYQGIASKGRAAEAVTEIGRAHV